MNTEKHISIHQNDHVIEVPLTIVHTLVLGSGASGLNAAAQLRIQGIENVMILTEGTLKGDID